MTFKVVVCSLHGKSQVPSYCLEHGLLVFCCPSCLKNDNTNDKKRIERGELQAEDMCNVITADTAAKQLGLHNVNNQYNNGENYYKALTNKVTDQYSYGQNDYTACMSIVEHLKERKADEVDYNLDELKRFFIQLSELVRDHLHQLFMFFEFLEFVANDNTLSVCNTNPCLDDRCKTCNSISKNNMSTYTSCKTFVSLSDSQYPEQYTCKSQNLIYIIADEDCPGRNYVGETEKQLNIRMAGHRSGKKMVVDKYFSLTDFKTLRVRVIYSDLTNKTLRREIERRLILELKTLKSDDRGGLNDKLGEKSKITDLREMFSEDFNDLVSNNWKDKELVRLLRRVKIRDHDTIEDPIKVICPFPNLKKGYIADDISVDNVCYNMRQRRGAALYNKFNMLKKQRRKLQNEILETEKALELIAEKFRKSRG